MVFSFLSQHQSVRHSPQKHRREQHKTSHIKKNELLNQKVLTRIKSRCSLRNTRERTTNLRESSSKKTNQEPLSETMSQSKPGEKPETAGDRGDSRRALNSETNQARSSQATQPKTETILFLGSHWMNSRLANPTSTLCCMYVTQ